MNAEEAIIDRLNALILQGLKVEQTQFTPKNVWPTGTFVNYGKFHGWLSQSRVALVSILGEGHGYVAAFDAAVKTHYLSNVNAGVAILKSVTEDFENGNFKSLRGLISGEIFVDFLDMAEHLLENDYKDPAAMLTGATLESGLKRIATDRSVDFKSGDGLSSVNDALYKASVYNKLTHRQVQVWTTIRNHADHGEFDKYLLADVMTMLSGVREFLTQYVS